MATAFYLDALFAVCLTHHALAHAEPIEFEAIAIKCLKDQYYELQALSRTIVRFREADYKRIAEALEGLAVLTNWKRPRWFMGAGALTDRLGDYNRHNDWRLAWKIYLRIFTR
jgi:hypothetical protein